VSGPEPTKPTADSVFERYLAARGTSDAVRFPELCRRHAEFSDELRVLYAAWQQVDETLEALAEDDPAAYFAELFGGLQDRRRNFERYEIRKELGRGGMGVVLEVWDKDLERPLAMKLMQLQPANTRSSPDTTRAVGRFLEEAQITGQLEHPGIVSVHELGLDDQDRLYFTMQRIDGDDLGGVLKKVIDGTDGWTIVRALGVLLRSCEAVAYAHDRGVIHRDLKPANIMVGRFGETYVMDWGLARLKEAVEMKSVRRAESPAHADAPTDGSPLMTQHGDVIGTPAYMPPEQADGRLDEIGPHSDVYAMGAILYHLLSGLMPYGDITEGKRPEEVWKKAMSGPPTPLASIAPRHPPELIAICEKAMARVAADRYASMSTLADDLRAYLENRVVAAHATGPWVEFRKWITRNRALATTLLGGILVVVIGTSTAALVLANKNETIRVARAAAEKKTRAATDAQQFLFDLFRMMDPISATDGRALLASDLLDRGMLSVDTITDRETRVRILSLIGGAYLSLGQDETARPVLERALREDEDPESRLGTISSLGSAYGALGMEQEAREMLEEGLAEACRELGDEHRVTVTLRNNLAMQRMQDGDPEEAARLFRRALEIDSAEEDPNPRLMTNLAHTLAEMGQDAEAEKLLLDAISNGERSSRYGPRHAFTLEASMALGNLFAKTDRDDDAIDIWTRHMPMYQEVLGKTHPAVTEFTNELAQALARSDRAEEAEALLLETRELYVRELGEDSYDVKMLDAVLGVVLERLGRLEEAEERYRAAWAWFETRFGPDALATTSMLQHVVRLVLDAGRGAEERPLLEQLRASTSREDPFFEVIHERIDAVLGPEDS